MNSHIVRMALSILLALVARLGAADPPPVTEPIVFLVVADLHVTDEASLAEFRQVIDFANRAIRPAFTFIAGDTPDGGKPAEYEAFKKAMDTLKMPVHNVLGDHEARGDGRQTYQQVLGSPTGSFDLGRCHFIRLDSMAITDEQVAWAARDLAAAKQRGLASIILIHHNFAGIKDPAARAKLEALVKEHQVKLVLAGHTHNNTVINDGAVLHVTPTSLHAPKGKDGKGYAIVTLDEGRVACHLVPLDQRPVIATASPIDKLMATGPEGVVHGAMPIRVRVFDTAAIASVVASIDGGSEMPLKGNEAGLWTGTWNSAGAADGEHVLLVKATAADGRSAEREVRFIVNQAGAYTPAPATVSDAGPGGPKGPKPGPGGPGGKDKPRKQPVTMDQCPPAVREAISKVAANAPIDKLEREMKKEGEVFTARWIAADRENEAKVLVDGKLLESKKEVALADVPAAVRQAIEKSAGKMDGLAIREKTKVGDAQERTWEIEFIGADGTKQRLKVGADGGVEQGGPKPPKEPRKAADGQ